MPAMSHEIELKFQVPPDGPVRLYSARTRTKTCTALLIVKL